MADLEEMGFVASPHTSAGRVPTPKGYRLFVDTLLTVRPLEEVERAQIEEQPPAGRPAPGGRGRLAAAVGPHPLRGRGDVAAARAPRCGTWSSSTCPRSASCSSSWPPTARCRTACWSRTGPTPPAQLVEAANAINQNYAGMDFATIASRVRGELLDLHQDISSLMRAAIETGGEAMRQHRRRRRALRARATSSTSRTSPPTGRGCASSSTSSSGRPSCWACWTRASAPRA